MIKKIIKFLQLHLYHRWRIPKGDYCYFDRRSNPCPYWDIREDWPEQENGYCHFLGWGDMDKNNDESIILERLDMETGEVVERTPASEMPFGISLLWDQCKECGVNLDDELEMSRSVDVETIIENERKQDD